MDDNLFKNQYYQYLQESFDVIKIFEKYRKKLLLKVVFISLLFFSFALVLVYILSVMIIKSMYNPILFPVLLFMLYACLLKSITTVILTDRQYQIKYNEEIMPLILYPVANFKDWPKNKNTEAVIDSKLFKNFDTQEDSSCVFGYYKTSSITISDTRLTLPVKASGKPDIFKGTIIQIDIEKFIKNHIIFLSKNLSKNFKYPMFKINVEGIEEYLSAYAKNNSDMEFIAEKFFDLLKKIAKAYDAKSFAFSYKNNTVLIAMKQRKAKPFGYLFKSLVKLKNYDEFIEKLIVIYEIADYMNNN